MCTSLAGDSFTQTQRGRQFKDGRFIRDSKLSPRDRWESLHPATRQAVAVDVPLGEGLADAAKLSILTRREKLRQAEAAAE